jgi:acetyl esterase/lipase
MRRVVWAFANMLLLSAASASAQTFELWPGPAPGSEKWTQSETTVTDTPLGTVVFNVVTPTLTAYLPEKADASGTAVIIAPGGAFVALAMDLEGRNVATWLQKRGIAAFVLKYRVVEKRGEGIPTGMDMDEVSRFGIADGIRAIEVVRERAVEFGVAPDRVGFLGFSAGAMVASGTALNRNVEARPNFVALLYGAPFGKPPAIPKQLPPLFLAWAQNDDVALEPIVRFHKALEAAGHRPEVHIFSAGGHGFGMKKQGTSSDYWIDTLYYWLEGQRLTTQKAH